MSYESNCLRLSDLDQSIYRVFPEDRFFETFTTRNLVLVRPHLWDDPFENFLYAVQIRTAQGQAVSVADLQRRLYGQCWSMISESDAMWRIYVPDKNGVKVKTTIRKLIRAIYDTDDQYAPLKYFIGRVNYVSEGELLDLFADTNRYLQILADPAGRGPVEALLLKRTEFGHEEEVRLVYQSSTDLNDDTAAFRVDPNDLFDEVVFDPRLPDSSVQTFTARLRSLAYMKPVSQSKLYRLPPIPHQVILR